MERRCAGVGERSENVEDRPDPERRAHRTDGLHGGVIVRRKQKGEVAGGQAGGGLLLIQRDLQAECLQHIGAASAAGDGTVAVLDDGQAACGRQQCGSCGNVETAGRIATRAHHVDGSQTLGDIGPARQAAHAAREASDFVGDGPFGAQRGEDCARQGGRGFGVGQMRQQLLSLRFGQVAALEEELQQLAASGHEVWPGSFPSGAGPPESGCSPDGIARPPP